MQVPRTLQNISVVFLTQLASRLFTALALIFVLKHLSTAEYGAVTVVQSLVAVGSSLLLQGLNWSMIRSLASHPGERQGSTAGTVGVTFILEALLLLLQGVILLVFGKQILAYFSLTPGTYAIWAVIGIISTGLLTFASSVFQGLEQFRRSSALPLAQAMLVLLVYVVCSTGGWLSLEVVLTTIVVAPLLPFLATLPRLPIALFEIRQISSRLVGSLRESRWFITYTFLLLLVSQLDVLMMARFFTLEDVGLYGVAARVYSVILLSLGAIHTVLLPKLSGTPDPDYLRSFLRRTLKWTIPAGLVLTLPLIIWAEPVVVLISKDAYADAALPLRILMAGAFFSIILSPPANILFALHRERFVAFSGLLLCVLELVGHLTLTRRFGSVGAASVVAGGYGIVNALVCVHAYRATRKRQPGARDAVEIHISPADDGGAPESPMIQ